MKLWLSPLPWRPMHTPSNALDAAAVAFDHLHVHADRVTGRELGDFLVFAEAGDLFLVDLVDDVHGKSP